MLTCLFYTQLYGEGGCVRRDETCGCTQKTRRDWHSEYLATCTRSCSKMTRNFMVFRMNTEQFYPLSQLVSCFDHSEGYRRLSGGPKLKESLFYVHFRTQNCSRSHPIPVILLTKKKHVAQILSTRQDSWDSTCLCRCARIPARSQCR